MRNQSLLSHGRNGVLKLTTNKWGESEYFISVLLGDKEGAVSSVEDGALLVVLNEVKRALGVGCVPGTSREGEAVGSRVGAGGSQSEVLERRGGESSGGGSQKSDAGGELHFDGWIDIDEIERVQTEQRGNRMLDEDDC